MLNLKLLLNDELSIHVNYPLHLWKSIRSSFQSHPISLFDDSPFTTNYEKVKEMLEIGKALEDTSSSLFENLLKLIYAKDCIDASFILPFACWIVANFSISIDLSFRLLLIELSFHKFTTSPIDHLYYQKINFANSKLSTLSKPIIYTSKFMIIF